MESRAAANLSALIESTKDLIWSVDLDYRLTAFNRALQENIQKNHGTEPALGVFPWDILSLEKAAFWPPLYDRAIAEGPFRFEYPLADGRTLELSLNPILVDGVASGVSVFGKDITERKSAEQALRVGEKRYHGMFDNAVEGIFQTTRERKPLRVNRSMAKMLGYESPDDLLSVIKNTEEQLWFDPKDRVVFVRKLDEFGAIRDWECRFRRKDGSAVWISMSCWITEGEDGTTLIHEGFIQDITERKEAERRLSEAMDVLQVSESHYRTAFQTSLDTVSITRLEDGMFVDVNDTFFDVMGFKREELLFQDIGVRTRWVDSKSEVQMPSIQDKMGRTNLELNMWVDPGERLRLIEILRQSPVCREFETRLRKKGGEIIWVLISASLMDWNGVCCLLCVIRDITRGKETEQRLKAAAEALQASEARYHTAFQTSPDSIAISRLEDGMYIDANQALLLNTGYQREEVVGRTVKELDIWSDATERSKWVETMRQNSVSRDFEAKFRRKNGELFWGLVSASIIELDGQPCILSMTRDISAAKEAEEKILSLSLYDPLTCLPNRLQLMAKLRQSLAVGLENNRKKALLLIDLDHFKTLNDTLGHPVGDLLLQEVARRLADCTQETDLVARLGGDEFVVLLNDLSDAVEEAAEHTQIYCARILAAIGQNYNLGAIECRCSASIGVAILEYHGESADEVLKQADIAMDQAKAAGRNTMRFFAPALQEAVNARATLEKELRKAIGTDQFLLYYQPQISDNQLIGAEALIRWMHPQKGLISPGDFIPLAEQTGLIHPLGDWVLETACRELASWETRKQMAGIMISVNISARQFLQKEFVGHVLATIDRTGANPQRIKLELTESLLADNIEELVSKMTELKLHGLRFSLDDFGTGYSSLSYLKRLPLDELKIDLSFVRDILEDASSGAIAQAIVSLSRALGLSSIAEGVETEAQREYLLQIGCHSFQGYLFSRPLPTKEFERLMPDLVDNNH